FELRVWPAAVHHRGGGIDLLEERMDRAVWLTPPGLLERRLKLRLDLLSLFPVKVNTVVAIEYDARETDVERQTRALAAHKDGASRRHHVTDAELIEHVGVLEGEIDQYDCFIAQRFKHIDVDNLRAGLLVRSNRCETRVLDGTLDDDTVNFVEIEVAPATVVERFEAKGHHDEARSLLIGAIKTTGRGHAAIISQSKFLLLGKNVGSLE